MRADLFTSLAQNGQGSVIENIMRRDFAVVDDSEMLEAAFERFQSCECLTIPVLRKQVIVGLLTMENVGEFIAIRAALKSLRPVGVDT